VVVVSNSRNRPRGINSALDVRKLRKTIKTQLVTMEVFRLPTKLRSNSTSEPFLKAVGSEGTKKRYVSYEFYFKAHLLVQYIHTGHVSHALHIACSQASVYIHLRVSNDTCRCGTLM
jgi:hypothetical protein